METTNKNTIGQKVLISERLFGKKRLGFGYNYEHFPNPRTPRVV